MNLDLPFPEADPAASAALDDCLAEIDRTLDSLFLEAVAGELERLRLEHVDPAGAGGAAA